MEQVRILNLFPDISKNHSNGYQSFDKNAIHLLYESRKIYHISHSMNKEQTSNEKEM